MKLRTMPSSRESKRYLFFRVHSQERMEYLNLKGAIWNSLVEWLGENELANAGIRIIKNLWKPQEQTGVIQCSPKYVDQVKMGLSLIHQIGDSKVIIQVKRVSGTIKSLEPVKKKGARTTS